MVSEWRYALRSLFKSPRFVLPAIFTLALGLGGALAFYSAFHSVFLRALPFPGASRIYRLVTYSKIGTNKWPTISYGMEMQKTSPGVDCIGILGGRVQSYLTLESGDTVPVQSLSFDAGMQRMSGLRFSLGSGFQEQNFISGRGVILGHRFWKSHFGGDTAIVGRTLRINNMSHGIQGVLAENSEIPLSSPADVYSPVQTLSPAEMEGTTATILIRLREGAAPETVLQQLNAAGTALARNPDLIQYAGLQTLRKAMAEDADWRFFVVCGAAALFLLLATANVAGLFLARTAEKSWETTVRLCLGAPGSALFRRLLIEGLAVALISAALAFWLHLVLADSLRAWIPGGDSLPGLSAAWDHLGVALFGLALVFVITLLLALIPMLQIRRLDLSSAVQEGHRSQSVRTRGRTALVVVQMTLATLMLCATALLGRSFWAMTHRPTGFETEKLAMVQLLYNESQKKSWQHAGFLSTLRQRPGIQSAAVTHGFAGVPGMSMLSFGVRNARIGDAPLPDRMMLHAIFVSDRAFETLGVAFLQGRDFKAEDAQRKVCILNREAERLSGLPRGKAVGQKLFGFREPLEIMGVVPDFHLFQDDETAGPAYYTMSMIAPPDALFVRSTLSRKDLEATVASVMHETSPGVKAGSILVLSELRGEQSLPQRRIIGLLAAFGGTAIVLAALGLSALLSDSVSRRRRELGIRAALGAAPKRLVGQVLLQGLWRTGLGVGLGLAAALASGRYLQNLLFGIRAGDPMTLAAVASFLLFLGSVSSLIPALRAASIDPARALREE
jgi:putative ABC transport system permease protein